MSTSIERDYQAQGYAFPIDILSQREAREARAAFEAAEEEAKRDEEKREALSRHCSWVLPFADALTRHPAVLDAVSVVLGPNLMVWGSEFFVKEPRTPDFVSWHQDLHYWGLAADEEVTVWLALSPATPESGCMRFLPGSHTQLVAHRDTFAKDNMLSRGQEVAVEVNEAQTMDVVLQPGQASLHHGRLFHASHPNRSADRRIGFAVRYITPQMRQSDGSRTGVSLVKGMDTHGHFELVPPPKAGFAAQDMARHRRLCNVANAILYQGAAQGRP